MRVHKNFIAHNMKLLYCDLKMTIYMHYIKTIPNLSRQYLHTDLSLSERFGSFV